ASRLLQSLPPNASLVAATVAPRRCWHAGRSAAYLQSRWADAAVLTSAAAAITSEASPCFRTPIVTVSGCTPRAPSIGRQNLRMRRGRWCGRAALAKAPTTLSHVGNAAALHTASRFRLYTPHAALHRPTTLQSCHAKCAALPAPAKRRPDRW